MIELSHVTKTFGGKKALDELSLRVPQGAVYGLIGSNGAGKSTAIRHLTGIYRPDAGTVTIGGLPVYENPEIKSRIGYIPDDLGVLGGGTIRELAAFYRAMYPRFDAARFDALREVFRLDERTPLRRFSKGMQKHAAFWLTLCIRPDYLVLDEPVDGLDPVMRRQIWSLVVEDVAGYGMTVLVSSHNLRELEDICDHVGMMHAGRMLLERSLAELQENIVKVQLVTDQPLPEDLAVLHASTLGRVQTLIIRGEPAQTAERLAGTKPLLCDLLPLSLEEIFMYGNPSVWKVCGIAQPLAALPPYGCGMPLAGTQSIPAIFKPQFGTKSLADRSCNLIRGSLKMPKGERTVCNMCFLIRRPETAAVRSRHALWTRASRRRRFPIPI